MIVESKKIVLKDGRECILRNSSKDDSQEMIDYLVKSSEETEYLLRYPDEVTYTLEQEAEILENARLSPYSIFLVAEVDGKIAGNAGINPVGGKRKLRHRATLGIALLKEYWNLGIGTALLDYILEISDNFGYEQVELEVVSENERAISLYKKADFDLYGKRPDSLKRDNGKYFTEFLLLRKRGGKKEQKPVEKDCCVCIDKDWYRYRASGIIVEGDEVLVVTNDKSDYYYSVGGGVHIGETSEEAVVRELYEETGNRYEIDTMAVIHENFFKGDGLLKDLNCHELCMYYFVKPLGIKAVKQGSTTANGTAMETLHWLNIDDLGTDRQKMQLFPVFLKDVILEKREKDLKGIPWIPKHIVTKE